MQWEKLERKLSGARDVTPLLCSRKTGSISSFNSQIQVFQPTPVAADCCRRRGLPQTSLARLCCRSVPPRNARADELQRGWTALLSCGDWRGLKDLDLTVEENEIEPVLRLQSTE